MDPLIIKNRRCQSLVWNDRQNIPSDWNEWFGTCEYNMLLWECVLSCVTQSSRQRTAVRRTLDVGTHRLTYRVF